MSYGVLGLSPDMVRVHVSACLAGCTLFLLHGLLRVLGIEGVGVVMR